VDVLGPVQVEGQLGRPDHGERDPAQLGDLAVLPERRRSESRGDYARRAPEEDVRPGVGDRWRGHGGTDRLEHHGERVGREQGQVAQDHRQCVGAGRFLFHLTHGGQEAGILLGDGLRPPARRHLQHRLVGRDDARLPSGDRQACIEHVLQHRQGQRRAFQRAQHGG
jgi:hypothetical protein